MRAKEFITEALSTAAIDATANQLGNKLMLRLKKDTRYKKFTDPKSFIEWVASDIDPTPNSRYARWIVALYANNGVRLIEDLHKLTDPLTRYARLVQSGRMPAENRDINKFKNLDSFLDLMDQYQETKTSNELKSEEEKKLFDTKQAKLYKDTGDIKIVIPKTELAAKYYGRGTRWCTAGDKDNAFDEYDELGPLYVIIFRNSGRKFQFHFNTGQFMDEQDKPLAPDLVKPISKLFPERLWEEAVEFIPDDGYTDEDLPAIAYVDNPSKKLKHRSIEIDPTTLAYIENPTEEEKLYAVTIWGPTIEYIEDPSEQVQLAAVKNDVESINHIKNPTERVIQYVHLLKNFSNLPSVINSYEESEICDILEYSGDMIKHIKNPTEKMQLAAVSRNYGKAIKYIKNPTEKVQLVAVGKNSYELQRIKNPTEKVQLAAVSINPFVLKHIKNPSLEVQLAAIKNNGFAFQYIKNPSEQVQLAVVEQRPDDLYYIKNPTEKVQLAAVKKEGLAIQYIKNPSIEVQLEAVNNNGFAIRYIKNPSEQVQLAAVKQDPYAIRLIKDPTDRVKRAAGIR